MSTKKKDPVLAVLQYFQETELPLAQQALSLAQAIVKTRGSGQPRPAAKPRAVTPKQPPGPQAAVGE